MKVCPKCETTHNKFGKFCSRSCANSREFTKESKEKKSISNKKFYASMSEEDKQSFIEEKWTKYDVEDANRRGRETKLQTSWNRPYEEMSNWTVRKRLLFERNYTCEGCGQGELWQGKRLPLELDHIDGNNKNNRIENLRILCPNCHSQTPTFRARNIKFQKSKV